MSREILQRIHEGFRDFRDYLLKMRMKKPGYGPSWMPTQTSEEMRGRNPSILKAHRPAIYFVAKVLVNRGVADLERLSTALLVTQELSSEASVEARAQRINELKAHVAFDEAETAVREVDRIIRKADEFKSARL